jgi:hypothetical protein
MTEAHSERNQEKIGMNFNPLFKDKKMLVDKKCVSKVYVKLNDVFNNKKLFYIFVRS